MFEGKWTLSNQEGNGTKLEHVGIKFTKIYLIAISGGIPALATVGALEIKPLYLNELGDLMAGLFGPLAIFWVVLGFFQQGKELRNSVATLELQAKELANSVAQQRELVGVTREQLSHERKVLEEKEYFRKRGIQPNFSIIAAGGSYQGGGAGRVKNTILITNSGAPISRVSVKIEPTPFECKFPRTEYWETGKEIRIEVQFKEIGPPDRSVLSITFQDADKDTHTSCFRLTPVEGKPTSMHVESIDG